MKYLFWILIVAAVMFVILKAFILVNKIEPVAPPIAPLNPTQPHVIPEDMCKTNPNLTDCQKGA